MLFLAALLVFMLSMTLLVAGHHTIEERLDTEECTRMDRLSKSSHSLNSSAYFTRQQKALARASGDDNERQVSKSLGDELLPQESDKLSSMHSEGVLEYQQEGKPVHTWATVVNAGVIDVFVLCGLLEISYLDEAE